MNEDDQERGLFKQLVLIAWLAFGWCQEQFEKLSDMEVFWWLLAVMFTLLAFWFLKCTIAR